MFFCIDRYLLKSFQITNLNKQQTNLNNIKNLFFQGQPHDLRFGSLINDLWLIHMIFGKWTTQPSLVIKPVPHNLLRKIKSWGMRSSAPDLNICHSSTEWWIKLFSWIWIEKGTDWVSIQNLNWAKSGKIRHSQPLWLEPLYKPYHKFGFWLFEWSRCGRIAKKSSRKDSWYQDFTVILMWSLPDAHMKPLAFVPKTARHIWKQVVTILVERTSNQTPSVLVISIKPGSLLVVLKISVRSLIQRRDLL